MYFVKRLERNEIKINYYLIGRHLIDSIAIRSTRDFCLSSSFAKEKEHLADVIIERR